MFFSPVDFTRASQVAEVHYVLETASTQDALRSLAGATQLTTVVAGFQTRGRGRLGRTWESRPGQSLLASTLVVLPDTPSLRNVLGYLTLMAASAMRSALARVSGGGFQVKYPNDVVDLAGRKIAGVLGEFFADVSERRGELCLALGVGVNVYQRASEVFPGSVSLRTAGLLDGQAPDAHADPVPDAHDGHPSPANLVDELLATYLAELRERLALFAEDPASPTTAPLIADINAHLAGRGQKATVAGKAGVVRGLSPRAELILDTPHGDVAVSPGEVAMLVERTHARPEATQAVPAAGSATSY